MRTVLALLALAFGSRLTAADDKPVPTKDAAAKMTVPEGFKVTLFAGEPDVVQPIAFTFDDRGRMWVVECLSYPKWRADGKGSDRVLILEDTDGDGVHDKRTVFLDNGVNLSGIEYGFGGIWLCSVPNLVFIPVKDGIDKPAGEPVVVLDGWNMKDTKHNIFNSLGWGPDGWLYGCNGIQSKSYVGAPGTPQEKRTYMDCGVWRYHPTRKTFEAVAHGTTNPFGLDWDEYGEMFVTNCVIDHLFHFVPGGHYQRMYGQDANPHTYGLMKSCVDYKHWAGGDWTSSRTTGVGGKPEHSDAGGGHAHSGCAIYLGDNFPPEYRNTLFTANIHGNRLNNDGLARTPSGYKGVRRPDFLFANDSWFRGICVKTGPEGGLYVSDWCDTGECHNYDKADTTNGRIYRTVYKTPKVWKGDVSKLTDAELVTMATSHANEWFVRKARRVLQERALAGMVENATVESLQAVLKDEKVTNRKLRAMWTLAACERLTVADLVPHLASKDDHLCAWAMRFVLEGEPATKSKDDSEAETAFANALKTRPTPYVLAALASASQRVRSDALELFLWLFLIGGTDESLDPQIVNLVWYALLARAEKNTTGDQTAIISIKAHHPTLRRNAARYYITRRGASSEEVVSLVAQTEGAARKDVLSVMRESLAGAKGVTAPKNWPEVYGKLTKEGKVQVLRELEAVAVLFGDKDAIASISKRILDTTAKVDDRRAAVELLMLRKQPEFAKTLRTLLDDPAVRQVVVRGLAGFADAETPAAILKAYPKFTADEKLDAVNTLAARTAWANALLDAVEKNEVARADIPVTTARQILALNDKALTVRLDKVWGKIGSPSAQRVALTKKWKDTLTEPVLAKGDAAVGRVLFVKHCGACHKMFGEGGSIAPELTGSQRSNLDYILENVLDPSAVVPREYQLINFTTTDERVIAGTVLRETKDAVTIQTPRETLVLPTGDIAARKQTNVSMMPEGLFEQMKPDEVRDLVAYLRAKDQVPPPTK